MGQRRQLAPPQPNRPLWNKLTEREQAILAWAKLGHGYGEIARQLGTTEQCVKNAMKAIMDRLGTHTKLNTVMILLEEKQEALRRAAEGQGSLPANGNSFPSHLYPATANELEDRDHAKDVITTIGEHK